MCSCRAVGRASNLIAVDAESSDQALQGAFPDIWLPVVSYAMRNARSAFGRDARMTEAMWRNAADVHRFAGVLTRPAPTGQGGLWTNQYLVNVPPR